MTIQRKNEIIKTFIDLLEAVIVVEEPQSTQNANDGPPHEMLTIKECSKTFKGLSEHAIRQLVAQGKIPYVRIGESKRGKILISKAEFENFLKISM